MKENKNKVKVAYVSMEIALENDIKTYAGGLGVLAGDLLRSAAELKFPMIGISLFNPKGYLKQKMNFFGQQVTRPETDFNYKKLKKLNITSEILIGKEKVKIGVWQYCIKSKSGFDVLIYFVDTNIEGNSKEARNICGRLYGADRIQRLKQEIVLGRGGVRIIQALGYNNISKIHLNEGHGSLAGLELLVKSKQKNFRSKLKEVKNICVFTTHTSIPNSQEVFPISDFLKYQRDFPQEMLGEKEITKENHINFTGLGFYFSSYVNAVSKKHQEVVRMLYPEFKVQSNTNGVNSIFWTADEFKKLYDKYIPNWRKDNSKLIRVNKINLKEIDVAHRKVKQKLIDYVYAQNQVKLKENIFTIGYARRVTSYKRPTLLLSSLETLLKINNEVGKIQIIYSGKAYPSDIEGQKMLKLILSSAKKLKGKISLVFLENYDLDKAKLLVSGVDLWLNTPLPFNEASGTSGMKAAHNGVPQLSTLDGWWLEGYKEAKTGWAILEEINNENNLYKILGEKIIPLYYNNKEEWLNIMQSTISLNASYFNSQRTLKQYIKEAYKINIY